MDRAVANQQWINLYKHVRVENLPIVGSAHGPILLTIDTWSRAGKFPPFRFEAKWVLQESFMQLVKQTWRRYINGSTAYQLIRKIDILNKEMKIWKKQYPKNNVHNIDQNRIG